MLLFQGNICRTCKSCLAKICFTFRCGGYNRNHYRQGFEILLRDGLHNVPTNCVWSIVMRQHGGGPKVWCCSRES